MQKSLILAVETSSRIGSVAIALGDRIIREKSFSSPLRHSAEIFPAVRDLLDDAGRLPRQIEQVYISNGPGSFTGLRIAVAFAKTMHLANGARIITVDTLDTIAANVMMDEFDRIAVILDAKRGQFFIAVYERKRWPISQSQFEKTVPDSLRTISQFHDCFARRKQPIWLLGDGLVYYKDRFKADGVYFLDEQYWSPRASKIHLLGWQKALKGEFADPLNLTPNYLRKPDVNPKVSKVRSD